MSSEALKTQERWSLNTTQSAAVEHCLGNPHILLVADKGAGKTRTGLAVAAESGGRVLILCPNKVRGGWVAEGRKLGVEVALVEGDPQTRQDILKRGGIMVMGVDLIKWLADTYKTLPCDGLILDETTRFSSPGSVGVKKLRGRVKALYWTLGLTASPVMEDPMSLYGQCLVLDGGQALGRSYDRFKQQYFIKMDYMGYDWQLRQGGAEDLAQAVAGLVYVMEDAAYAEALVPLVEEVIEVAVPPHVWQFYQEIAEELAIELNGGEIEAANLAVVSGKLEQLTQGAVYDQEQTAHWVHFAKMDALASLLDGDDNEPTIVVYQFKYELEELQQRFPWGRDLKYPGALDAFTDGDLNLLFMHPKSGSHGINAQARCCEMICLKPIWSADAWDQVIGRIRRRGQVRECRRRTLIVRGSIDDLILDRLAEKEQAGVSLLDHIRAKAQK